MTITRRDLIAGLAAGAGILSAQDRTARGPSARLSPALSAHSEQFPKIGYDELGGILRTIGFEGCVISVGPTGHITPEHADLDLMRFIEATTGVGVDVPALATTFTNPMHPTVRLAFAVAGEMGIPIFRPGEWRYGSADVEQRTAEVQRDVMGFASQASQAQMALALHNGVGDTFGASLWDIQMMIRGVNPRFAGYDFDIGYATAHSGREGADVALRMALPRLKMVTARDCIWSKTPDGVWKVTECPLGEGMVDWPRFFSTLARVRFTGPILLAVNYGQPGELDPVRKDLEFLKRQRAAAFGPG